MLCADHESPLKFSFTMDQELPLIQTNSSSLDYLKELNLNILHSKIHQNSLETGRKHPKPADADRKHQNTSGNARKLKKNNFKELQEESTTRSKPPAAARKRRRTSQTPQKACDVPATSCDVSCNVPATSCDVLRRFLRRPATFSGGVCWLWAWFWVFVKLLEAFLSFRAFPEVLWCFRLISAGFGCVLQVSRQIGCIFECFLMFRVFIVVVFLMFRVAREVLCFVFFWCLMLAGGVFLLASGILGAATAFLWLLRRF